MDHMDGDHIVDVPDTPDRLANNKVNERSSVREEKKDLSMSCHSGKQEFFNEGTKNQPMLIDSRTKKLSIRPPNGNRSSRDALRRSSSPAFIGGSTSSSRSTPIFRKGLADKNPSDESHDSIHIRHVQNERPSCSSKSTSSQDGCFVDPTQRKVPSTLLGKASSGGAPRSNQVDDFRIRPGLANVPSSNNMAKFSMMSQEASERTENMNKVGSSIDDGERVEFVSNIQNKPGQYGFPVLDPNSSPRINRQKRLVRNGCISPHNIAKAKQLARKDDNGFVAVAHAHTTSMASTGPPVWNDIKELVAEDHNSYKGKGKGVMNYPEKELDNKNKHLLSRNSLSINEKDMETPDNISGASKSIEKSSGWRSTHNRTRKMSLRSSDEERFPSREIDVSQCVRKHHENRVSRKEKGSSVAIDGDYHRHPDLVSSQLVPAQPVGETVSHPRPRLAQCNGHHSAANTLMKRRKQGPISISSVEGSTSTNDDSEIVFLNSSGESSNPRSTSSGTSRLQPIIEIDDSPELKRESYGEDARARQLEADEMLARELQEQFYNEMPVLGVGEVDEHIALALQQEESGRTVSRGSNQALDPRDSLIANLRRQSYSRSSLNFSRRGSQVRASTSGRTTRLRGRFPGQPRTLSSQSRGRNSLFPASMDVDMRMHILETLEAFSDMGVDRSALQIQRDFNETDYEMLLALDDNNDQHGGASTHLINGLPQSTVQNANFEEACAICLETPTIGDTIRHLPCLHKFHKDCIDPWLRRRTSCPVCKSSIT
ncbi:unnamed protein product [Fraxinus pennsylvanica]|uniref:RING-type domain-containing protein n=1 Tax=Fraxinus pennsylvanica TaxID=56036 RepID=A0AAD2E5H9_9LAMI|nr:unnamed protein product [Fraxinus pennsylvanica]